MPTLWKIDQIKRYHVSSIIYSNSSHHPISFDDTVRKFDGNGSSKTYHHCKEHGHSSCEQSNCYISSVEKVTFKEHWVTVIEQRHYDRNTGENNERIYQRYG